MGLLNSIGAIISVVGRCSFLFFMFYLAVFIKEKIWKPKSAYKLTVEEHQEWCRRRNQLNLYLCILYLVMFVTGVSGKEFLFLGTVVLALVVYCLRVKNNLKYVR